MTHSYISGGALGQKLRRLGLTALLAGGTALAAQAQLSYTLSGVSNTTTSYTDLGSNGTVIATPSNNTDDANSTAAANIGFNFNFNNTVFTQFYLNTNGFIKLGNTAPSATAMFLPEVANTAVVNPFGTSNTADPNIIAPFNFDLTAGSAGGTEYRVYTSGTAGSQICTIQWKNVADKAATVSTQYANFSFQVRLYEATGVIEMVYSLPVAGTGTAAARYSQVGIKGTSFTNGQILQLIKQSADLWSAAVPADYNTALGNQAYNTLNFRQNVLPDAGRTFRFSPPIANDAAVTTIYTLGKLPSPTALPHSVQAIISNTGTSAFTNLVATLNVTGANTITSTQTIASLAAGASATVTFAAYPTTLATGVNTVTVTIPADANTANNSASVQQTVNQNSTFSYIPTNQSNNATGGSLGTAITGNILAAKYTTSSAATVPSVNVFLQDANSAGKTVSAVVLSATGTILGSSASYVIQAGDVGTYKSFTITPPPAVAAGASFLVGLAEAAYTGTQYFPVGLQTESPTRAGAFYSVPLAGGTPTDLASQNFGRLMIEAVVSVTQATSKELQRAVTIYPNPSTSGIFNLDIHNANAQGLLGVEVTNQLGQRVYTGSAHDNLTNTVDLSGLAAGLYHLQVRNGQEFSSTQISVVK